MITISSRIKKIMDYYGYENQREMLIEECAEAIQAVQKLKRVPVSSQEFERNYEHLKEEIADLLIVAAQMYMFLGDKGIDKIIDYKITRQIERIEEENAEDRAVP